MTRTRSFGTITTHDDRASSWHASSPPPGPGYGTCSTSGYGAASALQGAHAATVWVDGSDVATRWNLPLPSEHAESCTLAPAGLAQFDSVGPAEFAERARAIGARVHIGATLPPWIQQQTISA